MPYIDNMSDNELALELGDIRDRINKFVCMMHDKPNMSDAMDKLRLAWDYTYRAASDLGLQSRVGRYDD